MANSYGDKSCYSIKYNSYRVLPLLKALTCTHGGNRMTAYNSDIVDGCMMIEQNTGTVNVVALDTHMQW